MYFARCYSFSLQKTSNTYWKFEKAFFRSPDELRSLAPVEGIVKTAIHFQKEDEPDRVSEIEAEGKRKGLSTGAFLAARWKKP